MDNTKRFSDRVENYIKYRPHYPIQLISELQSAFGFDQEFVVADIGSGTGISSIPFLENGNRLLAVEPNLAMRKAAETLYVKYPNFSSVNGAAENTTLSDYSVDLIFCAQAFHWFNIEKAKKEFNRILKPGGHIVLVWNERNADAPFTKAYNDVLKAYLPEYSKVDHRNFSTERLQTFFEPKALNFIQLPNDQTCDLPGLQGRLKSASYCPLIGELHDLVMNKVEVLFKEFAHHGSIRFDYKTKIYWS